MGYNNDNKKPKRRLYLETAAGTRSSHIVRRHSYLLRPSPSPFQLDRASTKGEPNLEKLPRSGIQSGDTWTFKSGTPSGEPPEFYRGGLLDLTVSSISGELLGFLNSSRLHIWLVFSYVKIRYATI